MDELGDGAAAEQGLKLALAHEDAGHWNCAYQALGVLYSKAGDLGGGHSRPVDLSAPPEHDADANFRAALRYAEAHRNKDALRLVERALAVEAKPRFMALRAFLLVGTKNYEMARPLFAQAAQSLPRDPGPAVGRGHLLVVAQDYEAAKREFDVGLARLGATSMREVHGGYLDFVEGMARLGLGWLHANQDQHVLALTHFDAILEHRPDDLLANLGRGNSLMGLDDLDGAQQQLRRVLQINPGNPYARSELASIDLARGDVAAAEEGFRAALEAHDAGYTCPYEGLGLVYLRQGRVKEAQANFEKAISLNPDIEYKKFNGLARIYMQDGRLDEAEQLLRRSMRNFPHDGKAAAMLVELERLREESHR
jgi:tetratricopeptide (TPR) repeat protein